MAKVVRTSTGDLEVTGGRRIGHLPPPTNDKTLAGKHATVRAWDMAEDLRNGITLQEVADSYGLTIGSVAQRLSKGGWSRSGHPIPTRGLRVAPPPTPPRFYPPEWYDDAICRTVGGDTWFPEKGESTAGAKKVCAGCPVRRRCREYAIEHEWISHGVWGGITIAAIRRLRRQRKRTATEQDPAA